MAILHNGCKKIRRAKMKVVTCLTLAAKVEFIYFNQAGFLSIS
jgi:hypothetical protein